MTRGYGPIANRRWRRRWTRSGAAWLIGPWLIRVLFGGDFELPGAVLALIVSAIVWGLGSNSSNPHLASRGKVGVLVSCGAAIICGAAVTLVNFFWGVGQAV